MAIVIIVFFVVVLCILKILDLKIKREQKEKENFNNFSSQFSQETLSDMGKFKAAFALDTKPFQDIPEKTKKEIISKNVHDIEGLNSKDYPFVEKMFYDIIIEGNSNNESRNLKNFLFETLKLKYKKDVEKILRYEIHKIYCQLHRIELLENGWVKVKWIYRGGLCNIEKHKHLHGIIFNLKTGFWDDELNKYIFPTDLKNCDCDFNLFIDDIYKNMED